MHRTWMAVIAVIAMFATPLLAEEPEISARKGMVEAHNAVRAQTNAGLAPLKWSDKLAENASLRAEKFAAGGCGVTHDGHIGRYGENVYWVGSITKAVNLIKNEKGQWVWENKGAAQPISAKTVVAYWAEGGQWYSPATNECTAPDDRDCGDYKQIVTRRTKWVGCAMALCPDNSQVWVCSYDPRGNFINLAPY